jgi:endonuclease G
MKKILLSAMIFCAPLAAYSQDIYTLSYDNWEIDYSCENRGYEYFHYTTVPDGGSLKRYSPFHQEKDLPSECRQFKTSSYWLPKDAAIRYDRGHGVHQNIWDHKKKLMKKSNLMSNIIPQASKLNRHGLWRKTEELTECYRDIGTVEVWGGVVWGNDKSNDHFITSHGVTTPDQLWKVIKFPDGEVNAWLMPNDNSPTSVKMDTYLVSPAKLMNLTGYTFDISRQEKSEMDSYSKKRPRGCSLK